MHIREGNKRTRGFRFLWRWRMLNVVFWLWCHVVLLLFYHFRGTYCFHLLSWRWRCFSKTLVTTYKTTWHHNPEDHNQQWKDYVEGMISDRIRQKIFSQYRGRWLCNEYDRWLSSSYMGGQLILWSLKEMWRICLSIIQSPTRLTEAI
jgi:hypothetical protein